MEQARLTLRAFVLGIFSPCLVIIGDVVLTNNSVLKISA